jgi:uncharacterized membrane-anchored protein YhcB (DUF1043 family)
MSLANLARLDILLYLSSIFGIGLILVGIGILIGMIIHRMDNRRAVRKSYYEWEQMRRRFP